MTQTRHYIIFHYKLPKAAKQNLTLSLSLSLSKLRRRSHGFSLSSDLTLFFARRIGSQHEAEEDPPIAMPHSSSSSPLTYLPVQFTFPSLLLFFSVCFSRKLNESIYKSVFVFSHFSVSFGLNFWLS